MDGSASQNRIKLRRNTNHLHCLSVKSLLQETLWIVSVEQIMALVSINSALEIVVMKVHAFGPEEKFRGSS
jgi:hypothetical protein